MINLFFRNSQKIRLFFLIAIILIIGSYSCRKHDTIQITIEGTVTNIRSGSAVSGASITLQVKEVTDGTYSNNYSTIGTSTTNGNGHYSFTFDNRNASSYKLTSSNFNYFTDEQILDPEMLSTNSSNTRNAQIYPLAYYKINIANTSPFDTNDQIIYQNLTGYNACAECCNDNSVQYDGMSVNNTIECMIYGESWLKFQWYTLKNGSQTLFQDSVFCVSFDTTFYNLNY